jgi:hypothetical protein
VTLCSDVLACEIDVRVVQSLTEISESDSRPYVSARERAFLSAGHGVYVSREFFRLVKGSPQTKLAYLVAGRDGAALYPLLLGARIGYCNSPLLDKSLPAARSDAVVGALLSARMRLNVACGSPPGVSRTDRARSRARTQTTSARARN